MGYSPWGHKELGTTERLTLLLSHTIYKSHLDFIWRKEMSFFFFGQDLILKHMLHFVIKYYHSPSVWNNPTLSLSPIPLIVIRSIGFLSWSWLSTRFWLIFSSESQWRIFSCTLSRNKKERKERKNILHSHSGISGDFHHWSLGQLDVHKVSPT